MFEIMKVGGYMEKGKLIGEGRTAEVFQWGEDKILKLFRTGMPKIMVENEYKTSLNICENTKLIPRVYKLVEMDNRTGIVYEKINGITMLEIIASKPWRVKKEAKRLAEIHKSIQQKVNFDLPNFKTVLKDNIAKTDLLSTDVKDKLYEYTDELADDKVLCHGDFHPDNVLISKNKETIIDWMTATQGSPLADVARTSIILLFSDVPVKSYIKRKIINYFQHKFYSEYIKHYINISGAKLEQIEQWELPIAAARLIEGLSENEKTVILKFIDNKMKNLNY